MLKESFFVSLSSELANRWAVQPLGDQRYVPVSLLNQVFNSLAGSLDIINSNVGDFFILSSILIQVSYGAEHIFRVQLVKSSLIVSERSTQKDDAFHFLFRHDRLRDSHLIVIIADMPQKCRIALLQHIILHDPDHIRKKRI